MKLEDAVAKALFEYPSLYKDVSWEKSKIKIYDHLFLVIGNGFKWHDGYLGEKFSEGKPKKLKKYGKDKYSWRPDEKWFSERLYRHADWSDGIKKLIEENPAWKGLDLLEEASTHIPTPYPVCEYSAIITVPDDVKPDWLQGAIETTEWALGFVSGPPQQIMQLSFVKAENVTEKAVSDYAAEQREILCKALLHLKNIEKKSKET